LLASAPPESVIDKKTRSRKIRVGVEVAGMATKHNITVAIDAALLKKARAVAAQRGLSVSALLASQLRELVNTSRRYNSAHKRALTLLEQPLRLGGKPLSRDELHERRRLR
jgi:hypothetical protein